METTTLPKLTLQVIILLARQGLHWPTRPTSATSERVSTPAPQRHAGKAARQLCGRQSDSPRAEPRPRPQPPQIQPAQPAGSDRPLPINLATALYLSNARPLVIASAEASVREAAAQLQGAKVLRVPNLSVGPSYYVTTARTNRPMAR